mgnify:CR=1 FL=1
MNCSKDLQHQIPSQNVTKIHQMIQTKKKNPVFFLSLCLVQKDQVSWGSSALQFGQAWLSLLIFTYWKKQAMLEKILPPKKQTWFNSFSLSSWQHGVFAQRNHCLITDDHQKGFHVLWNLAFSSLVVDECNCIWTSRGVPGANFRSNATRSVAWNIKFTLPTMKTENCCWGASSALSSLVCSCGFVGF